MEQPVGRRSCIEKPLQGRDQLYGPACTAAMPRPLIIVTKCLISAFNSTFPPAMVRGGLWSEQRWTRPVALVYIDIVVARSQIF